MWEIENFRNIVTVKPTSKTVCHLQINLTDSLTEALNRFTESMNLFTETSFRRSKRAREIAQWLGHYCFVKSSVPSHTFIGQLTTMCNSYFRGFDTSELHR